MPVTAATFARAGKRLLRAAAVLIYLAISVGGLWVLPSWWEAATRDYAGELDGTLTADAWQQYAFIRQHLQQPFRGEYARSEVLSQCFAPVALSHIACGLMNVALEDPARKAEIIPLLAETVRRCLLPGVSGYDRDIRELPEFDDYNMYFSHLNLVLGCHRAVSGDTAYDALARRVSEHLAARSLRDGDFHAPSFNYLYKWPADQAVTLCSLYLYDRIHRTRLAEQPIAGWKRHMAEQATDPETGLPWSAITTDLAYAKIPRGCALSWTCLYAAQFDPALAGELYRNYRRQFYKVILGYGGLREWPVGRELGINVDSGLVFLDIGMSATGLAFGPVRLWRDQAAYAALHRTAALVGLPLNMGGRREYRLAPLLGEAIFFHGATARRWFGEPPAPVAAEPVPAPVGPVLLLLLLVLLLLLAGRRLFVLYRQGR